MVGKRLGGSEDGAGERHGRQQMVDERSSSKTRPLEAKLSAREGSAGWGIVK